MKSTHTSIAETMQRTIENVLLGDWRTLGKDQLLQGVAHVRTIKAHYISSHLTQHREIQHAMLFPLDQALTALYLLLDTLEGRDVELQQRMYRALQDAQAPLLAAYVMIPCDDVSDEEGSRQDVLVPAVVAPQQELPEGTTFRWTKEQEQQLIEEMAALASEPCPMNAKFAAIAERNGWPQRAVEYKFYALQRKEQAKPREGQESGPSTEGDRSAQRDETHADER